MACKCSSYDIEEGWKCSVTGDRCLFLVPSSKYCAEIYGEGPDAEVDWRGKDGEMQNKHLQFR